MNRYRRKELRSIIDQLEELRDALETLKEEEEDLGQVEEEEEEISTIQARVGVSMHVHNRTKLLMSNQGLLLSTR